MEYLAGEELLSRNSDRDNSLPDLLQAGFHPFYRVLFLAPYPYLFLDLVPKDPFRF
jgi:hypothetical protein